MPELRIGMWLDYAGWRGVLYPPELAHWRELELASRRFSPIEINGSFYRLQRPPTFHKWYEQSSAHFL